MLQCRLSRLKRPVLVLKANLIVQERRDKTRRSTRRTARFSLVRADGVIAVQSANAILIHPSQQRIYVEWEETLAVQDRRQSLRTRCDAHGLAVLVLVHLGGGVEAFFQRVGVGAITTYSEDQTRIIWASAIKLALAVLVDADAEDLGGETCVDAEAGGLTGVASQENIVLAADAQCGTAVVGVSTSSMLVSVVPIACRIGILASGVKNVRQLTGKSHVAQ